MESRWVNSGGRPGVQGLENGWPLGQKDQQNDNVFGDSGFESHGICDGRVSPIQDLLMPSLELNEKIDLSSLISETMGAHIDPDELWKMDPWSQLDNLLEDHPASSSSGDSSPLHSPFSTEGSDDHSPSGSLCGESTGSDSNQSSSRWNFPQENPSQIKLEPASTPCAQYSVDTRTYQDPTHTHSSAMQNPKLHNVSSINGQQLVTVTTSGDGQNVVLLLPTSPSTLANLTVETKPTISLAGSGAPGAMKSATGAKGAKPSAARKNSVPYPQIRPKASPTGSRSQTPAVYVETGITESLPARPPPPPSVQLHEEEGSSDELFAWKREQRKIRNREAAQQSRQRRKEYLESLQVQMEKCTKEINRLKQENSQLREENQKLKKCPTCAKHATQQMTVVRSPFLAKSTAVCLLALVFLLTVNFGPFLKFSPLNPIDMDSEEKSVYKMDAHFQSRALMAVAEGAEINSGKIVESEKLKERVKRGRSVPDNFEDFDEVATSFLNGTVTSSDCIRLYFNQTESQRLTNELSSWAERHAYFRKVATNGKLKATVYNMAAGENEDFLKEMARKRSKIRATKQKLVSTEELNYKNRDLMEGKPGFVGPLGFWAHSSGSQKDSNDFGLRVFNTLDPYYVQLLEALRKRDDTFYLVSFRRDYMLLPASRGNNTAGRRPKMSLVVPALPLNETMMKEVPKNHIPMMQIECEVTATGLIHVPESVVPSFSNSQKDWAQNKRAKQQARKA